MPTHYWNLIKAILKPTKVNFFNYLSVLVKAPPKFGGAFLFFAFLKMFSGFY
jgi:hypothetical protein